MIGAGTRLGPYEVIAPIGAGVYSVDGGPIEPVSQFTPQVERPVRWSGDGKSIFVRTQWPAPLKVLRIDLATGRKEVWKDLTPVDLAGMVSIVSIAVSPTDEPMHTRPIGSCRTSTSSRD